MPIYAYKCETCGHAKDVLQKMSDPLLTECPACGAATFKKQLTAAGFQLKGSGWYATDFKNGGTPATSVPAGDKSDSVESVKTDTSSGDSKTEAKSVTKSEPSATTPSTSKPTESAASKPAASSGGCAAGCGCH